APRARLPRGALLARSGHEGAARRRGGRGPEHRGRARAAELALLRAALAVDAVAARTLVRDAVEELARFLTVGDAGRGEDVERPAVPAPDELPVAEDAVAVAFLGPRRDDGERRRRVVGQELRWLEAERVSDRLELPKIRLALPAEVARDRALVHVGRPGERRLSHA